MSQRSFTEYVLGFMFSPDLKWVALIEKKCADGQSGYCSGIGGRVEEGEGGSGAMAREFFEETGVETAPSDWILDGRLLRGDGFKVFLYHAISRKMFDVETKTKTGAEIVIARVIPALDGGYYVMPYVPMLITHARARACPETKLIHPAIDFVFL